MEWKHALQHHVLQIKSAKLWQLADLTLVSMSMLPVIILTPFQGSLQQRPHLRC